VPTFSGRSSEKDEGAALAVALDDVRAAILVLDPPGDREAEAVDIEAERGFDVRDVEHGAGEPLGHDVDATAIVGVPCALKCPGDPQARYAWTAG
jgi:hypothetical protein